MSRLLVLGLGGPDPTALVTAAAAAGHTVHCLTTDAHGPSADPVWQSVAVHHIVDFASDDIEHAVVDYATGNGIDGVVTLNEYLTPLAARVTTKLGLPGNDATLADAPRDKAVMARQFAAHDVLAPRTVVLDTMAELLHVVPDRMPLPVVVKPVANAGSNGVTVVTDPADLPEAFAAARAQGGETAPMGIALDDRVLVQEYVEGREYSVESVTQHGHSAHLCITRKITSPGAHRVEIGHSLPTRLDPRVRRRILDQTTLTLAALGVTNSVSHTEVIVTATGDCRVIEAAARIGAGRIGVLVHLALGIDMPLASVDLALGNPVSIAPRHARHAVSRLFVAPAAGRLTEIRHLPDPGDDVHLVQLTRPIGGPVAGPQSNKGRVGHFIVHGTQDEQVNRRADELLARVRVSVDRSEATEGDGGHQ